MAVSEASIAQRTFAALVAAGADPAHVKIPNLVALIPDALELLGKRVAAGMDYQGLQTDFSATPAAGLLDLSSLTGLLFDLHRSRVRVSASGISLQPIDSLETLERGDLPNDQVYYAQDGSTLRFRSTTPALNDYATALKIRANFIPSVATLPSEYEGALVRVMVELAGNAVAAAELTETGR